jgi:aminopeptidase N
MLEPKEEQSITLDVESEPLLVNFDYGDTLIKELIFDKPITVLIYQFKNDADVTGRLWALEQLVTRAADSSTTESKRKEIVDAIGVAVRGDQFWGVRAEATRALSTISRLESRPLLLAALTDVNARVRTAAVEALQVGNDPALATTFIQMLSDKSYATTRAAAVAVGATKSDKAYAALRELTIQPSWRDSLRASGLSGLATLGDPRALDVGLMYAGGSNPRDVRLAALSLLGAIGKDDPRVFPIVSDAFVRAVSSGSTASTDVIAKALVMLGDPRAIGVFREARNNTTKPEFKFLISQFEQQLLRQNRAAQ